MNRGIPPPVAPPVVISAQPSIPPPSAVPSIPVVSLTQSAGGASLSLSPGAKIVAPALPRKAWRKALDAAIVAMAIAVIGWWGVEAPSQIPALVGVLGTVLGYYFRRRKPQASTTAGALPAPLSPPPLGDGASSSPPGPPWP
jgi:uncharacterized membrane protein YfcA